MPSRSFTSRRELEEHSFHPAIALLVPLAAVLLQSLLPRVWPKFFLLDLPLLMTVFFSVSRRSPIAGAFTGLGIGLLEDALTGQPLGVNGIAKTLVGYIAASIGLQVDVDALTTRAVMNFVFSLLNSLLLYVILRRMLGLSQEQLLWRHELLRAGVNAVVSLPLFYVLDQAKRDQ